MTPWVGPLLPLASLVWPLLLGALTALPPLRPVAGRLLPLATMPALWLAIVGGDGVTVAPDFLLGVTLELDDTRRLLLGMTAALWSIAGLAAQPMVGKPHMATFSGFWCLVLAGNLGIYLAQDFATFYVSFAAVSLASWFLIVHDRTLKALRAGRVYIVLALVGEVALLVGLIIGANAAQSMSVAEIRTALDASGPTSIGLALLILGLGIKAGLVPLHVWLPLAHPAAPAPGSAVLSGAIVKAGLFGLIILVPEGAFGSALMALGLTGAFGAALWGLTQANPKAVLAYSTISQMGLMIMLASAGGTSRETVPYFAMHHGLAKGALFLLVGVMMASHGRGQRIVCIALAASVSASVAGFPLTGGALAKAAVKQSLGEWASLTLSLSSVATSLILVWFLSRLWQVESRREVGLWVFQFLLPTALALSTFAMPWFLWSEWTGHALGYAMKSSTMLDAVWPMMLALPLAAALLRWHLPQLPPGDILLAVGPWSVQKFLLPDLPSFRSNTDGAYRAFQRNAARLEGALIRWRLTGALIPLLVLLIFILLS